MAIGYILIATFLVLIQLVIICFLILISILTGDELILFAFYNYVPN